MASDLNKSVSPAGRPANPVPVRPSDDAGRPVPARDAAASPAADAPAAARPKAEPNHVMGFFEGFVREGTETVAGLYTLVTTNPITTAKGLVYMATHPAQAVQAIAQPYTTAYKDGRYGELVGRAGFQVLTMVLTTGALSKADKATKVAQPTATMTQAATQVTDDFARHIASKKAVAELAGSTLKGAAYNKKLAALTATYAEDVAARLAKRGLAEKLATNIAASGLGDEAVTRVMSAGGKHVGASQAYRYATQALKAGMKPEAIAAELAKHGVSKTAAAQLPVATKLLMSSGPNAALIAGAANVKSAEAIAAQMKRLNTLMNTTTDDALRAGYKGQLDALKAATVAQPRTAQLVESLLKGQKIGRFERAGASVGAGIDNVGKVGEKIAEGGKAVKNVLDAPKTVGDYARVVGNVPVAIGAALDAAYEGTIATLRKGLELLPRIALPDLSWSAISKIRVPSPWEILTAPVAVPLGAAGWALRNPGRALGALSLMGTTGNVAKLGEAQAARDVSERIDADRIEPGFRYYELRDGDTLEDIARRELGDAKRWEEIYAANKELFDSLGEDGVIGVGTRIKIPQASQTAPAAPATTAPGSEEEAKAYKTALLAALSSELATTGDAETRKVLEAMKARLEGMPPAEVLALRPRLEEQGIIVTPPPAAVPPTEVTGPAPTSQAGPTKPGEGSATPAAPAQGPAAPSTPAASPQGPASPSAPSTAPVASPAGPAVPPAAPAAAPAAPPAPPSPYTVKEGDTLWDISGQRLGDPRRWRDLVDANAKRHPNLSQNPDFILPGWKLDLPVSPPAPSAPPRRGEAAPPSVTPPTGPVPPNAATPVAPSTPPATARPAAQAPAAPETASAPVPAAPSGSQRAELVKQFNLAPEGSNFDAFWREVSAYPQTAVGPDTGTEADRKGLQTLLKNLGYEVEVTGDYFEKGADGQPKTDAQGMPVSPTAAAVIHFKRLAGIKQSYQVLGGDGKPQADVNEYVDARTRETMTVALRLLQNPDLRQNETMEAAAREAARLQASSIGPEVGSREGRQLVQQYLAALGYAVPTSGQFDESTTEAILDFKRRRDIAAGFKDDKGQAVYTPYVDGRTADALLNAVQESSRTP
ncbi:MAG: peptidoglycan-binding protein [Candidatus Sericytochromatia bacterium]|nr:peptidoglycan-binding protein [Candidatus Sericytochromatia bacterium]